MVQHHPTNDANKQRDATPARKLRQDAKPCGVFRCDRCDRVVPDSLLVVQDGYSFCRTLCADETSITEFNIMYAKQLAETDSYEPNVDPPVSAFSGVTVVTSTPTWPVTITNAGSPVSMTFGGVNFASDITITYGAVGISDNSSPVISSTSIVLSVIAEGVTPGLYDITIGDYTYNNVLKIQG